MLYPLAVVALSAAAMTAFTLLLARFIPDRYDDVELAKVFARRR